MRPVPGDLFDAAMVRSTLRMATPVLLAALGALVTEAAGILNIGLEGMMLVGAFSAVAASYATQSAWVGLAAAVASGALMALLLAAFSLRFRANIVLMGVAVNIFAAAFTSYLVRFLFGTTGTFSDPRIKGFAAVEIPLIEDIPVVGGLLSGYTPIVYISWALVILAHIVLYKMPVGVHLRATGESPEAAEAAGIKVNRLRYFAVILSGALASTAGAYLSLGHLSMFVEGMSAGRGFMGIAANILGMGTPGGAFAASLVFGFADALTMRLQGGLPPQIVLMLPPVLTVAVLVAAALRARLSRRITSD